MKLLLKISIVTLVFFLAACNKGDETDNQSNLDDCLFVHDDESRDGIIDSNEMSIMMDCVDNSLSSKIEIEQSLIGEWKLIGHGVSWNQISTQPCSYIIITEDSLTYKFENNFLNTTTTHLWELNQEVPINGKGGFSLSTNPDSNLFLYDFCEDYIFGNETHFDGEMYLYERVR